MSLVTQMFLLDKYGPILSVANLADLMDRDEQTIRNQISAGAFEIPTTRNRSGRRVAHYQDAAAYIDSLKSPSPSSPAQAVRAA